MVMMSCKQLYNSLHRQQQTFGLFWELLEVVALIKANGVIVDCINDNADRSDVLRTRKALRKRIHQQQFSEPLPLHFFIDSEATEQGNGDGRIRGKFLCE